MENVAVISKDGTLCRWSTPEFSAVQICTQTSLNLLGPN